MAQIQTGVPVGPAHPRSISRRDARVLEQELRACVAGEVRFDDGSRALYSTDSSNYRQIPIGVVVPRSVEDIVETVAACRRHDAPIVLRGGGTSLAGQTCNVAVVIDTSKYLNRVLQIDPDRQLARVQPGVILDDLRNAAEQFHLTFGPDPATHNRNTLGGMIGNNSCGVHSVMAGTTADNVEELEVLTFDGLRLHVGETSDAALEQIIRAGGRRGEVYRGLRELRDRYADLIRARFPDIPRRISGYALDQLLPENGFNVARALVGTEGTCVTVLGATLRLVHSPPHRALVVLGYADLATACGHVPELLNHKPVGLEGFDGSLIADMRKQHLHPEGVAKLPSGGGWLIVEFGGETPQEASAKARELAESLGGSAHAPKMKQVDDRHEQQLIWEVRESALGAAAQPPGERLAWPGWEDSAVPPDRLGDYIRDLHGLMDRYGYQGDLYGHFGEGCIHVRFDFELSTAEGISGFRAFVGEAADLVVRYGGSLSGEHGDGQARAELLPKMYGPELVQAFSEFKSIWDPAGQMNPGKVVDPDPITSNLRLGVDYEPANVRTHFRFPDDGGSFARASLRCVGVGQCRRLEGGTMCPSFMVTREEEHSTRGRSRLLFEMLQGDVIEGWRDDHVRDALDLCLACKGCKGDCPIHVDMATYKAEFLSHYYARRLRPRTAYAMGLIHWWARLGSLAPSLVNAAGEAPVLGHAIKLAGGIAPQRRIPAFAPRTFRRWFAEREPRNQDRPRVILWPDTFNDHFKPKTAQAAVEVLEAAGYQVVVPRGGLCCGRPLYDFGMLDLAERLLRDVLRELKPDIEAGVPLVGLEPSCLAVFRDELVNLLPEDEDAQRLSRQSYLLSEFLAHKVDDYAPPKLRGKAIVHGHCHHKALMGMADEETILSRLGLDYQVLDSGCCGMAGAFGFEQDHYEISRKVGERVLLPAVRDAPKEALVIADGFSCREQIAQETNREALHLAEVLQMALHQEGTGGPRAYPERSYAEARTSAAPTLAAGAAAMAAGGALALTWRRRRNG